MERTEVEKFDSESSESIDWEKNNRKRNQVLGNSMDQIRCITKTSLEYPKKMMQYPSMPAKLYVKGRMPDPDKITVAVIGARMCSPYGRIQAFRYAKELSQAGVQIISGMALGIDSEGHKGALEGKMPTFAVLGSGVDVCYPKTNKKLYERILWENGGIISECPLGSEPVSWHFPARNRIISALSDAVLVVEAKENSGSLITAGFALEQGKMVYAIPGAVTDTLSRGCHKLIYDGAGIAYCPEIILEELGIGRPSTYAPTISTIIARRYVAKENKNLYLTEIGEVVNNIMKQSFPSIVDVNFTANMESLLDGVEEGSVKWKEVIRNFYPDLNEAVKAAEKELESVKIEDEVTDVVCEKCGRNVVVKYGPHGKFLGCPGFPECRNTKPYLEKIGVACPKCGKEVVMRKTKKGRRYFGCEDNPECDFMTWQKPSDKKCPKCGGYMLEKGNKLVCGDENCGYVENRENDENK